MKKSILSVGLIISIILLTQSNAFAYQKFGNKIEKRQDNQSHRIEKGFNQGELTYQELRKLIKKQNKFERLSHEFLEDGYYSHREKNILRKKYDKLDGMIYRMKHNKKRFYYGQKRVNNRHQRKWKHARFSHSS